jgi:carbon monoxide dehydrogenase subunit G
MRLERKIHIQAAPAGVWAVVADIERWPEWTPSVHSVELEDAGPLRIGTRARLELRGTPSGTWEVTQLEHGRSFAWKTRSGPGVTVEAGHVVEPAGDGSVVTLSIAPGGPLRSLLSPLIVAVSRRNVDAEAEGLKRRCEQS